MVSTSSQNNYTLQNMLLGADEGLYLLDLTTASRPPVKIAGIGGVYQMNLLDGTDTITVITGLYYTVFLVNDNTV